MFLSLDGIDGVGKSTQMGLLVEWLRARGYEVVTCRDPGSTPLGERIRTLLLDAHSGHSIHRRSEMLLYMAARAQLVEELIRPALAAGRVVVSDRYLLANLVYQAYAGGLDLDSVRAVGRVTIDGVEPDLVLLLDAPPSTAHGRIGRDHDRMELEGDDFRDRLRKGFLAEAAQLPNRIRVVDAQQSIESVHAAIVAEVSTFMP